MDQLSAALSALADPSRRALLQRLAHGPATSGQLAELRAALDALATLEPDELTPKQALEALYRLKALQ